jgi:hypothetical protein
MAQKWQDLDVDKVHRFLDALEIDHISALRQQTRTSIPHDSVALYKRCERYATEWMITRPQSDRGAKLWAVLPRLLLVQGRRGGVADTREFKLRCTRFLKGLLQPLYDSSAPKPKRHRYDAADPKARMRRAANLAEQGHLSKAAGTIRHDAIPPLTAERLQTVRQMYPEAGAPEVDTRRPKP